MVSFLIFIYKINLMHKLQTHLHKHVAAKPNKIRGMNNFKISNSRQARVVCKSKNPKEKFKTNAATA
jgi:hypothetical protein